MNTILKQASYIAFLGIISLGQVNAAAAVDAAEQTTYAKVQSFIRADEQESAALVAGIEVAYNRLRELAQTDTAGEYADAAGDHDDVIWSITGAFKNESEAVGRKLAQLSITDIPLVSPCSAADGTQSLPNTDAIDKNEQLVLEALHKRFAPAGVRLVVTA